MVSAYALGNLADAADPNYNLGDLGGREALDELLLPYSDQAHAHAHAPCTMQRTMHHAPCSAPCTMQRTQVFTSERHLRAGWHIYMRPAYIRGPGYI